MKVRVELHAYFDQYSPNAHVILSDDHFRALDTKSPRRNLVAGWGANGIRVPIGTRP